MSVALGTMAAISAGLGAAKGVAGGISEARAGRKMFDEADELRLKRLQGLRRTGQLGLGDVERGRLEGRQAVERGGMLRTAESQSGQAMQALANQDAISGRDIFLSQMAQQEGEAQLRGAQSQAMAAQEMQARQAQLNEIASLREQQKAAEARIAAGRSQALTLGIMGAAGGAAEVGLQQLQADKAIEQEQTRMEAILEGSKNLTDEELAILQTYDGAFGSRRQRVNSTTGIF